MIPVMNDPLSLYWEQPKDIREAPMDDEHVILTPQQLGRLKEYSSSIPSGVYPGKCWKRINGAKTWLVWYGDETPEGQCQILFRVVLELK